MRTIVVPVNFTAAAANAARYAVDIALVTGSEIRLLYILESPSIFARHPTPDFLINEMQDSGRELLERLETELVKRTGGKVRLRTELKVGRIDETIVRCCELYKPFLVIMGVTSVPGQGILPDHAIEAMKVLSFPLLIVPEDATFHGAASVLIACDQEDIYSGLSLVLPLLKELRELLGTRFDVLHVVANGESEQIALSKYEEWKKELEAFGPGIHLVRQAHAEDGINDYFEDHAADWLMVLPKKHALIELHKSRARQIVLHCPVPVLSVHE